MQDIPVAIDGLSVTVLFGMLLGIMIIYLFSQKHRADDHRFLVAFVAVLMFTQLHSFLTRSGLIFSALPLFNTNTPFIFLFGPMLFLYTRSLLGKRTNTLQLVLHLVPFLLYFSYSFYFFLQDPAYKYNVLVQMLHLNVPLLEFTKSFSSDPLNIQGWVVVELLVLHLVAYVIFSLINISAYSPQHKSQVANSKIKWVYFLNGVLLIGAFILFLSEGGIVNGKVFFESPLPNFSGDLFSTGAMYVVTFYLVCKPKFLSVQQRKYSKSSLTSDFKREKLKVLTTVLEDEKLYLNPNFSLDMLVQHTSIAKHHLSQIINEELQCSFFDLTNHYRVEEAKKLLRESDYIKMEPLAYQLGYKSKSSFFNAFKKATNLTPSNYLNQVK